MADKESLESEKKAFMSFLKEKLVSPAELSAHFGDGLNMFLEELVTMDDIGNKALDCARKKENSFVIAQMLATMKLQKDRVYGALMGSPARVCGGMRVYSPQKIAECPERIISAIGDYVREKYEGCERTVFLHIQ